MVREVCLAALMLGLSGCADDSSTARTELMLVADTDITSLDSVQFEVTGPGRTEMAQGPARADGAPMTLGVVREGGSAGPITVVARGIRGAVTIVERSAVVSFVANKTLIVELHLLQSCMARRCAAEESCTERGCEPHVIGESGLSPWRGEVPSLDSAAPPPDRTDCGSDLSVDLASNTDHCGQCGNQCEATGRNVVDVCSAGVCKVECRSLHADCDGDLRTGCEQLLTVDAHCGACGAACAANQTCWLGSCR